MTTDLHYTLRFEISITKDKFHRFLLSIPEAALKLPSKNAEWKNGELLYCMSVAPLIITSILKKNIYESTFLHMSSNRVTDPIIQCVDETFVRLGAQNATRSSIAREYDKTCARVLEVLTQIPDDGFAKYLTVYIRDSLLPNIVSAEQLFHYVKNHFDIYHHQIDRGSSFTGKGSA